MGVRGKSPARHRTAARAVRIAILMVAAIGAGIGVGALVGTDSARSAIANRWLANRDTEPRAADDPPAERLGPFAPYRREDGTFSIPDRVHIAPQEIVILLAGATLIFGPNGGILCEGELRALGTEARPIRFTGDAERGWGNLTVQGPSGRASLAWVVIEHGRGSPTVHDKICGGGVAVYEGGRFDAANTIIRDCTALFGGGLMAYSDSAAVHSIS